MRVYAHTYYILSLFLNPLLRSYPEFFVDSSCQSRELLCTCDHRQEHSILYRSILNYSCHWAPNLCCHWSSRENMKRIQVVIWWPAGQGDFNIGIIERGICRFSPATALFTFSAHHCQKEKKGMPFAPVQKENLSLSKYLALRCGAKPKYFLMHYHDCSRRCKGMFCRVSIFWVQNL